MIRNDDSELVRQCLKGERKAFETLVDKYQKPIFNLVYRMCHHYDDARDVTQSVFIRAYQKLNSFKIEKKFFSWLYRIAINETLNHLNQQRKVIEIPAALPEEGCGPEETFEQKEQKEQIRRALMKIESKYRILIILKHFQNLSYHQIAEIMNLPEKIVKSRLYSARQKLGQVLSINGMINYD